MHTLYVVQGEGPTLLGRDWLQHIRLDWQHLGVAYVHQKPLTLSAVLQENAEVFKEELGQLHELTAKLVVKPDTKPRFCRPRSVPFALQEPIERELDKLEAEGVIEKVAQ